MLCIEHIARHTTTVVVIVQALLFPGQQNLTTAIKITNAYDLFLLFFVVVLSVFVYCVVVVVDCIVELFSPLVVEFINSNESIIFLTTGK